MAMILVYFGILWESQMTVILPFFLHVQMIFHDFPMSNVVISNGNVSLPERKLSPPFA